MRNLSIYTRYGTGISHLALFMFRTDEIILDKKYNIAKSSCHFGSYGSIWTGPSPEKNIIWTSEASVHIKLFW
jgi:hypothetical protein